MKYEKEKESDVAYFARDTVFGDDGTLRKPNGNLVLDLHFDRYAVSHRDVYALFHFKFVVLAKLSNDILRKIINRTH